MSIDSPKPQNPELENRVFVFKTQFIYINHQSKNGSSFYAISYALPSDSAYVVKQLVSFGPLTSGINGAPMSLFTSLLQFNPLKNLWVFISATPPFKLPYLLDKSACNKCFTKDFPFLSKKRGNLTLPFNIF